MSRVENFETGGTDLLILGADGTLGRDEFLRLLYGGRVSLAGGGDLDVDHDVDRCHDGGGGGLLPRVGGHDRFAADGDHDGVPGAAVRDRAGVDRRARS